MTTIKIIKSYKDKKIDFIEMKNDALKVVVTNYGCHILSIYMKDKEENWGDVVLGFKDLETYETQDKYIGALVGRFANRIKAGHFSLNGKNYQLAINNGPNHLHGGIDGFNHQVFDYRIENNQVIFTYLSKDKEEGYPGNLTLEVTYALNDQQLDVHYHAVSDQDTLINITNHSYFNLSSEKENILNHDLCVKADKIACIDADGLPTGEIMAVKQTPFDFNQMHRIGECLKQNHLQLQLGNGLDHPFILSDTKDQICLYHALTGRQLTVSTSLPCVQIYTANYLDGGLTGKYGYAYQSRDAVCIETEYLPDGIHLEKEPQCILKKGENYDAYTSYRFEVIK